MFYITQNIYPLTFLYAGPVTNEEAQEFLAAIRRHNERCKVRLVSAHGDEDEIDTGVDRFSRIRLEQFWEGTTPKELVTMDNYNWGYVWDKIDELDIAEKPQTAPSSATYTIPDISGEADLSGDAISHSS